MKGLLSVYKGMGTRYQNRMNKRAVFWLKGAHPFINQTPGRLQYYKAENEPFIPDNVKWAIRMPTRYANREETLDYEAEVNSVIADYVKLHFKFDVTNGKELDVANMTLGQLKAIYEAQSDKIKQM